MQRAFQSATLKHWELDRDSAQFNDRVIFSYAVIVLSSMIELSFHMQCPTSECRGRTFTPLRSSPLTQTIDWQTVRMQEISGDDRREAGRIPRTIECELTADLVDSCVPGDMVTITAVVKATGSEEGELYKL